MEAFIVKQKTNGQKYSDVFRKEIVAFCQQRDIALASHDDATLDHVEESAGFGMSIAEFPTTEVAAVGSHERGLKVLMGHPISCEVARTQETLPRLIWLVGACWIFYPVTITLPACCVRSKA